MGHIVYSGEPNMGSPPFNGGTNMNTISFSDPNARFMQMNQQAGYQNQYINPGMAGYNVQMQYPPMNTGFSGFQGNPALGMLPGMQNTMYQQPQYQDRVVHVPAFIPGGDTLYNFDIESKVNELCKQMTIELEEARVKRELKMQSAYANCYGNNFYGLPYYNNQYADMEIVAKYRRKAEEIRQEAVERKINLCKNLSRLANNYLGKSYTDKDIDDLYAGKTYTITSAVQQEMTAQMMFDNVVEVSNANSYASHHMEVQQSLTKAMGNPADMNEFLHKQGILLNAQRLADNIESDRNASQYYDPDAYKRHIRRAIMRREGLENNNSQNNNVVTQGTFSGNFPILSQSASMLDDGTISIKAPNFFGVNNNTNRNFVINNQMEQHYEENKRAFYNSIMNPETVM